MSKNKENNLGAFSIISTNTCNKTLERARYLLQRVFKVINNHLSPQTYTVICFINLIHLQKISDNETSIKILNEVIDAIKSLVVNNHIFKGLNCSMKCNSRYVI